ncbi:hypothetical protein ABW19_dt0202357 [Dactylella cylindrospora]|nr:hypothetical protein ABW19_dt0202357 [Dactylella cylindrospora]
MTVPKDADDNAPLLANTSRNVHNADESPIQDALIASSSGTDVESSSITSQSDAEISSETLEDEDEKVGWLSLPKKKQLILLAMCRLSEPISSTSLLSYVYYFIKSLPGADTPQEISRRAGVMVAAFSLCQFVTGMIWGRLSDQYGRKPVVVMGLLGSALASLGLAFSKNYHWAVLMRMLSGGSNATTGVLRTIVAELIREKRYQSRAFLIMPMCMNIGFIIGPILGGILANPIETHPGLFGPGSWLGGEDGIGWMKDYPYALPNIVSAVFLSISFLLATFGLEETNYSGDITSRITAFILGTWNSIQLFFTCLFRRSRYYELLSQEEDEETETETEPTSQPPKAVPYAEVLTPSVIFCLLCFILVPLHNSTFMQLYPIFLSTPRKDNSTPHFPLAFNGGLGLLAAQVGYGMAVLGSIGIVMQLFIYPPMQMRFGTLRSYRASLVLFPIAYTLTPFLAILPSTTKDLRSPAAGVLVWAGIVITLFVQVTARTFASPGNVILLINSVNNRRALGTVNGLGASLSSLARAVGPLSAGWGYGFSLDLGCVGLVWWSLAVVAILGWFVSLYVKEGQGFAAKEEERGEEDVAKDVEPVRR